MGKTAKIALIPNVSGRVKQFAAFFHPDYTVGIGITPNSTAQHGCAARGLAGMRRITAGGEFRPALKTLPVTAAR